MTCVDVADLADVVSVRQEETSPEQVMTAPLGYVGNSAAHGHVENPNVSRATAKSSCVVHCNLRRGVPHIWHALRMISGRLTATLRQSSPP